ncbi:HEAT domain-containing protein [Methanococcus voltae]|uniref:HEAT domain containing protein n=1 Tax=Methanococcus voltae (strain ATCC BAA-1334 / A3) TaxID=456320 RepID=D7DUZ6_METV3|nr:HEAT domain-containing protein [Methanococcus voltae]MCS3900760.1 hypothetical protein [Methanococcus voltae]
MMNGYKNDDKYFDMKVNLNLNNIEEFKNFREILFSGKFCIENPKIINKVLPEYKKSLQKDFKFKWATLKAMSIIVTAYPEHLKTLMPITVEMLKDSDWRTRKNSLEFLGDAGLVCYELVNEYMDHIIAMLDDENPNVVCSSAYTISKISLNPKCNNTKKLINLLNTKIKSKLLLIEILKNMSNINPEILKDSSNNLFGYLDDENPEIVIKTLEIIHNIKPENISYDNAEKIISKTDSKNKDIKTSALNALVEISKVESEKFRNIMPKIIEFVKYEERDIKIPSIYILNNLCHLNPSIVNELDLNYYIITEDYDLKYSVMNLLQTLSNLESKTAQKYKKIIEKTVEDDNSSIITKSIAIMGNFGKFDKYCKDKYIPILKSKFLDLKYRKESTLSLIKLGYVDNKIVELIFNCIKNINLEIKFLKCVFEQYPYELLDDLKKHTIKIKDSLHLKLKNTKNKLINSTEYNEKIITAQNIQNSEIETLNNFEELISIADYRINEYQNTNTNNTNVKLGQSLKIPDDECVVLALKSECMEVELEDGKQVYIVPKDKSMHTILSNELLEFVDNNQDNEFDLYKISHEIMIQSLIETALKDKNI